MLKISLLFLLKGKIYIIKTRILINGPFLYIESIYYRKFCHYDALKHSQRIFISIQYSPNICLYHKQNGCKKVYLYMARTDCISILMHTNVQLGLWTTITEIVADYSPVTKVSPKKMQYTLGTTQEHFRVKLILLPRFW